MKLYKRAILPQGFSANGVSCGIKNSGNLDLALFISDVPARAGGKFTTNKILAAPVMIDKKLISVRDSFRGIIVNSGNANCFTGSAGPRDADKTLRILAESLGAAKESFLIASTGIIGRRLPVHKIKKAIAGLTSGLTREGIDKAKLAILTTDTFPKEVTAQFRLGKNTVNICGIAKGAGMIAPNMATLLCFIFTDAYISQAALNKALDFSVNNSFNCITVDGCMSTNDSVIILANALAKNSLIRKGRDFNLFTQALSTVCLKLAKMIVEDAEGATKFITIRVDQARNFAEARSLALAVANSNLFKAAAYGEDPNFGRIAASLGASNIEIKEQGVKIKVSPLNKKNVTVRISVGSGKSSATVYTSDLTPEYIKINAEYN